MRCAARSSLLSVARRRSAAAAAAVLALLLASAPAHLAAAARAPPDAATGAGALDEEEDFAHGGQLANVVRAGCYMRYETPEGFLESPNFPGDYPPALDCCYDIARPSPQHCGVKLYAEQLTVRREESDGSFCRTDWLAMESCVPEGGSRFCGNMTGTTLQYLFQPGARALRLQFHSSPRPRRSSSSERRGASPLRFRLRYRTLTDCKGLFQEAAVSALPPPGGGDDGRGGDGGGGGGGSGAAPPCYARVADKRGAIRTPRHPRAYPPALDCVYEFVRPNPFICGVRMRSVRFELEPALATPFGGACSDFLQAPGCGFLCGKLSFTWLALYQPGATSQRFHFHSDEENHYPGFFIAFEQVYHCQQS